MPGVGDLLEGKYRIVRTLGKGGMGEVFEARNELIGKRVAIKCLSGRAAEDEVSVTRSIYEARAAAAIGHRSIIDIYDAGQTPEGLPFLVMEYLQGESLGETLDRDFQLSLSYSTYIAGKILSALEATHGEGIIHRDLKPDNIFLLESRQAFPEVKLLDFGISKMLDAQTTRDRLTRTGALIGTPMYMAPEQLVEKGHIDHRVDLYAMGLILYECVTGRLPFTATNILALMHQIATEPIVPPSQHNPMVPIALEELILTATAKDRNERFGSASEMLARLLPLMDESSKSRISIPDLSGGTEDLADEDADGGTPSPRPSPGGSGSSDGSPYGDGDGGEWCEVLDPTALASEPPRRGASWRLAALAVLLLVLTVIAAVTALHLSRSGPIEDGVDEPAPLRSEAPSKTAVITLSGVPEGAEVYLDGAPSQGREIHLEASEREHLVRVEAAGHRPWSRTFSATGDRTFAVTLEPLAGAGSGAVRPPPQAESKAGGKRIVDEPVKARRPPRPGDGEKADRPPLQEWGSGLKQPLAPPPGER